MNIKFLTNKNPPSGFSVFYHINKHKNTIDALFPCGLLIWTAKETKRKSMWLGKHLLLRLSYRQAKPHHFFQKETFQRTDQMAQAGGAHLQKDPGYTLHVTTHVTPPMIPSSESSRMLPPNLKDATSSPWQKCQCCHNGGNAGEKNNLFFHQPHKALLSLICTCLEELPLPLLQMKEQSREHDLNPMMLFIPTTRQEH